MQTIQSENRGKHPDDSLFQVAAKAVSDERSGRRHSHMTEPIMPMS